MKSKIILGFLIVLVSTIMLMSNALASGWPPAWAFQVTLSTVNGLPSQDPENSGFGTIQVVVWEEWNGADWDIHLKYHLADGNPVGGWTFPPAHPATSVLYDEINPAVTVTNTNPQTGFTEVHVVYQRQPLGGGQSDICHTWASIPAFLWFAPVVLDATPLRDAIDPAIVYTEDVSNPGVGLGMLVQMVWSEANVAGDYEIWYDAYYYDPTLVPTRGYVSAGLVPVGPQLIQPSPGAGLSCSKPEIASVDELWTGGVFDYYFAIVWQEQVSPPIQWNIWYIAGTTTISPAIVIATVGLGQLNPVNVIGDSYDPDIAATQDYQKNETNETYYFHVNWVYNIWGPPSWQIDTCYTWGANPTPPAVAFVATPSAIGPIPTVLDRPTIASKLINITPSIFETWMCWEDNSGPIGPNIWYRVGRLNTAAPPFGYILNPAAPVPYVLAVLFSAEYNPELWNRNDAARMFPPLTHLVFDMTSIPGVPEVEYIDP